LLAIQHGSAQNRVDGARLSLSRALAGHAGADPATQGVKERNMKPVARVLFALAIVTLLAGAPRAAAETTSKLPRIAYVWLASEGPSAPYTDAFRERMGQLGWTDGRTFVLEFRDAHGSLTELDAIMQALVQSKVDIIVAMCTPEGLSARKFTNTIPIVMAATGDPVAAGLAESFARPGGNVTGISGMMLELSAKRVGLMKEAFPKIKQVTAFWNPVRTDNRIEVKTMQDAGSRLAINVQSVEVRTHVELAAQLDAIGWDGTQAILTTGDTLVTSERATIAERAAKLGLPAIYDDRVYVEAGGIMSYGPNVRNMHRRAADFVDRILKGAKPADLPFEQPTKFELIVNNKAAKALGMTIPQSVLLQADEVIE
jgi:putative tryptophan/tyrosine transport system substrate-binding protein